MTTDTRYPPSDRYPERRPDPAWGKLPAEALSLYAEERAAVLRLAEVRANFRAWYAEPLSPDGSLHDWMGTYIAYQTDCAIAHDYWHDAHLALTVFEASMAAFNVKHPQTVGGAA